MTKMYCVKCRNKVDAMNPTLVTMRNGRKAEKGTCPKCGVKVFKIVA